MSQSLTERYDDRIAGMLSCYDRLVITGTLPVICYAAGMTGYLNAKGIRIFDYPEFAKTLRDRVRDRAATLAAEAGITIEHLAKPHIRKEDVVARVLRQRGDRPGLVHVISAMEACDAYKPWHDKQTHKTFIRPDSGKCLHYYFYFQDATFGLVYLRVPTWAPFRLQFYCNGHSWLARKLSAKGIGYTMADNAFVHIDDWALAQALADTLSPDQLHRNGTVHALCGAHPGFHFRILKLGLVRGRGIGIRLCCPQGFDGPGRITQVFPSHQVGVRIVVHDRVVFIGSSDGIDAEFPALCVRVEAEVQPEACRFHEHLGAAAFKELLIARRLHIFAQRVHDVRVDVVPVRFRLRSMPMLLLH